MFIQVIDAGSHLTGWRLKRCDSALNWVDQPTLWITFMASAPMLRGSWVKQASPIAEPKYLLLMVLVALSRAVGGFDGLLCSD